MSMSIDEFVKRRRALLDQMTPNSIAILPSAPERTRNRDVHYPFRQESDFYYLSGFAESDAVLVLIPAVNTVNPYFSVKRKILKRIVGWLFGWA